MVALGDVKNVHPQAKHLFAKGADKNLIAFTGVTSDSIKIYNHLKEESIEILDMRNKRDRECRGISFAGDRVVVGYRVMLSKSATPHYISVYDLEGKLMATKEFKSAPSSIVSDKNQIVVLFGNNQTKIFDPDTLEEKGSLDPAAYGWSDPTNPFNNFKIFTLQEGRLYTVTSGVFKVFDAATGLLLKEFKGSDGTYISAGYDAISIHGNTIALGAILPGGKHAVELWDFETGNLIHSYPTIGPVDTVALKIEEKPQLTVGIAGGAVQVWSPKIELNFGKKEQVESSSQVKTPHQPAQNSSGVIARFFSGIFKGLSWLVSPITAFFSWLFKKL